MILDVTKDIRLTEFGRSDRDSLVGYLNDKDIYDRTLRIPYPYTLADAEQWLDIVEEATLENGKQINWAIRNDVDRAIGGIVLPVSKGIDSHRSEIGYWLAKPFWGRGIMTAVVRTMCRHGFENLGLEKVTAGIFACNDASAKVLEKCGFVQEGYLRKEYCKDGTFIDAKMYGLLRC